jgi:hypothetical protein
MNDETALRLVQDYFEGKIGRQQFEAALDYFTSTPAARSRLAALYQSLVRPGGIDCETSQEQMLVYLDPIARATMPEKEREQFLLHLAGCADCAEEFLMLSGFEQGIVQAEPELKVPRFKVPAKISKPVVSWPAALKLILEQFEQLPQNLKIILRLETAPLTPGLVRETPAPYELDTGQVITVQQLLDVESGVKLNLTARRSSPQATESEVKVKLEGSAKLAGHLITLWYSGQAQECKTNPQGEARFENVPVSALPNLQLEIRMML